MQDSKKRKERTTKRKFFSERLKSNEKYQGLENIKIRGNTVTWNSKREKGEPLIFLFTEKEKYKGIEKVKL